MSITNTKHKVIVCVQSAKWRKVRVQSYCTSALKACNFEHNNIKRVFITAVQSLACDKHVPTAWKVLIEERITNLHHETFMTRSYRGVVASVDFHVSTRLARCFQGKLASHTYASHHTQMSMYATVHRIIGLLKEYFKPFAATTT